MVKYIFCCLLLLQPMLFIYGQEIRTISIDAANACPMNLSEIAERVTPIALEKSSGGIQNILLTNEYLFVASISSIVQYDLSGKFIREIACGGFVTSNVTCDTVKKEIYVPVGDKVKSYDYSGKMKKEYSLKTSSIYCLYHRGFLWIQSQDNLPDLSSNYIINKLDLSTGEVTTLPFEKKIEPVQFENGPLIGIGAMGCLSLYNEEVIVSFDFDTVFYKIQQNKIIPFVRWDISPHAKSVIDSRPLRPNGIIGNNIFINYRRDDLFYMYSENLKTGIKYDISNIVDDVFQTNGQCNIRPMSSKDYFYFIKEKGDIKENSIGNIPLKNGAVIFIVKTK